MHVVDSVNCWGKYGEVDYSFETCCRTYNKDIKGHPGCWHGGFTYEECCLPEMWAQMASKQDRIAEVSGTDSLREFSEDLFDFHLNFAAESGDKAAKKRSFALFEKSGYLYRKTLDDMPKSLSYFDVLINGLGINCEPSADVLAGNSSAVQEFSRCCSSSIFGDTQPCMQVFEMFAKALGHRQLQTDGGLEAYFKTFSEQWAFHHFTPSILKDSDHSGDPCGYFDMAFEIDSELAGALSADGEPMLGIVWAKHAHGYKSPKFCYGVYFLTIVFRYLQKYIEQETISLEIFEVGAGYGSLPRIVASAKKRLQALAEPIDVRRYVVLDVRSVTDLQKWYLNETLGASLVDVQDWSAEDANASLAEAASAPLRVELVDRDRRDLFVHAHGEATASHSGPSSSTGIVPGSRPLRLLIAVNSWHEMPMTEYFWYYNTFVAGPSWLIAADWILYLSNRQWPHNAEKEKLLLGSGQGQKFQVRYEYCSEITCTRLLQRVK